MREMKFDGGEKLSHAYILVSPSPEELRRSSAELAAAAVCSSPGTVPCGACRECRKVREGIHPDVTRVERLTDDKGRQKREIGIGQIRELIADSVVVPNEAARKVYIVEDADLMTREAQNAALKLLEEPPRGVVFILCAANAELLLETVRSRCVEIVCNAPPAEAGKETRALSETYLKLCAQRDEAQLFRWCAANEGMDNLSAAAFVECTAGILTDMLCRRTDALGLSDAEIYGLETLMEKCRAMLRVNTGVKHVFALLATDAAGK